jgi:microcystin degradation protein MlrC
MLRIVTVSITLSGTAGRQLTDALAGVLKKARTLVRVVPAKIASVNFVAQLDGADVIVADSGDLNAAGVQGDNAEIPLTEASSLQIGYDADTTSGAKAITLWFRE